VIEGAGLAERSDVVFKLAALPKTSVGAALIARGVDASNVGATADAIAAVGIPMNAEDAFNYSFRPRTESPAFPIGRFGDGTLAVCYSALERETCREEVRHHRRQELAALQSGRMPFSRYYTLVSSDFHGTSLMLRGREDAYPDLVSPTTAGYPFCQAVARWARGLGAQAIQHFTQDCDVIGSLSAMAS
jgi:RES domain